MTRKYKNTPKLIEIIAKQLRDAGNFESVEVGYFSDGSGSWIDCRTTTAPNGQGKRYLKVISFNGDGTEIDNISVYEEKMKWDDDATKELK